MCQPKRPHPVRSWALGAFLFLLVLPLARAEEEDLLARGLELLGGPEHEEGVRILRELIATVTRETKDAAPGTAKDPPGAASSLVRLGRAHFYLEEDRAAIAALERAAALDPASPLPPYWLGVVFQYSDLDRSRTWLERAVTLDPTDASAWYELGRVRTRQGKPEEALAPFLRAVEIAPQRAEYHYRAGVALQGVGRMDEAVQHLEQAFALDPEHTNAGYNLGLLHYLAGRYEPAFEVWAATAVRAPQDLQLHAKVVQACHALGRGEAAAAWREKVFAIWRALEEVDRVKVSEFCFDQFVVGEERVFAYERFDPGGAIPYPFVFRAQRDGESTRSVQVEMSRVVEELGGPPFVLGMTEGETHTTFAVSWAAVPPYPELKEVVTKALRGELPVGARSRRSEDGAVIELPK